MEKLRKTVVFLLIIFVLGGIVLNAGVMPKQDEAYSKLKEKYGVKEDPVTDVQEPEKEDAVQADEVAQTETKTEEVKETTKTENRTTENIIWDFLKDAGYSDIQTAAIIGNLYQESGLNSSKIEYKTKEGIGLVQWSFDRKRKLKEYCASKGVEWTDMTAQLEYLVKELNSREFYEPYKSKFENPYSIDEAVEAYCWGFERPREDAANVSYRKSMAWKAYYRNVNR